MGSEAEDPNHLQFVEVDPTGRYGRVILEYEGIEVAWNQMKLNDFLQSPEYLRGSIHLHKTLKHRNIMKFTSGTSTIPHGWTPLRGRSILSVSCSPPAPSDIYHMWIGIGKSIEVNIRAVKHWCRQIISGLLYLHSHDLILEANIAKETKQFTYKDSAQYVFMDLCVAKPMFLFIVAKKKFPVLIVELGLYQL